MTWHEAQERFGTDKPDVPIRDGAAVELSDVFDGTEAKVFQVPCGEGHRARPAVPTSSVATPSMT